MDVPAKEELTLGLAWVLVTVTEHMYKTNNISLCEVLAKFNYDLIVLDKMGQNVQKLKKFQK